jgi:D-glycero-D-manno-heptose 1,7-bisphosphate phosphatase
MSPQESQQAPAVKCVFFDRDGIVNEAPGDGYVERWADFRLLPEFVEALLAAQQRGYVAVIITNQRGVALGKMTLAGLEEIHANLRAQLRRRHGTDVLDILYCPHDRDECDCRKPKPGMLLTAARRHGIDLAASWMVGDNEKDVEAGRAAGCRTIRVSDEGVPTRADYRVSTVGELAPLLKLLL